MSNDITSTAMFDEQGNIYVIFIFIFMLTVFTH